MVTSDFQSFLRRFNPASPGFQMGWIGIWRGRLGQRQNPDLQLPSGLENGFYELLKRENFGFSLS
jgi:hypothetical protein